MTLTTLGYGDIKQLTKVAKALIGSGGRCRAAVSGGGRLVRGNDGCQKVEQLQQSLASYHFWLLAAGCR